MSRLRDKDLTFPSHAAILRQQKEHAAPEPRASVGMAVDRGYIGEGIPGDGEQRPSGCWIVGDQDEPLRYI
jgi:hypothetical protein